MLASIRFDARQTGYPEWAALEADPGRAQVSHDPADLGAFRTMGLRNIKDSPPYMHNGALATLADVVRFYDRGGGEHPNKSALLRPLGLTGGEIADLVAFLEQALQGRQRPLPPDPAGALAKDQPRPRWGGTPWSGSHRPAGGAPDW